MTGWFHALQNRPTRERGEEEEEEEEAGDKAGSVSGGRPRRADRDFNFQKK